MSNPAAKTIINFKSLREQVYDYLRDAMNRGELAPGAVLNLNDIVQKLGISRTPLRDALIQLEIEGFVQILPRRGCIIKALTLNEIKELYHIIGALEASLIFKESQKLDLECLRSMQQHNHEMQAALDKDDFNRYYAANLAMHNCYLNLTTNQRLKNVVNIMKQRLYDFPRKQGFVKEWELASIQEHDEFIHLIEVGEIQSAANFIRDVHWSYQVQERFIEQYYIQEH